MITLAPTPDAWRVVYSINLSQYVVVCGEMRVAATPSKESDPKARSRAPRLCVALNRVYGETTP
jgi:hypothetical protein